MNVLFWIVVAIVAAFVVGLFTIVLLPNKSLPPVQTWTIGQGARGGLGNVIIGQL